MIGGISLALSLILLLLFLGMAGILGISFIIGPVVVVAVEVSLVVAVLLVVSFVVDDDVDDFVVDDMVCNRYCVKIKGRPVARRQVKQIERISLRLLTKAMSDRGARSVQVMRCLNTALTVKSDNGRQWWSW
jgi:hypothetical protein